MRDCAAVCRLSARTLQVAGKARLSYRHRVNSAAKLMQVRAHSTNKAFTEWSTHRQLTGTTQKVSNTKRYAALRPRGVHQPLRASFIHQMYHGLIKRR